jgi:signal transduction histidine kinase
MVEPGQAAADRGGSADGAVPVDPSRRHGWRLAAMDDMLAADTVQQVLERLAGLAAESLGDVALADLLLPDGQLDRCGGSVRAGFGRDVSPLLQASPQHWRHPSREVISTARLLRGEVADDAGASRFAPSQEEARQLRHMGRFAYLFVPLKAAGRIFGALGVCRFGEAADFSADDTWQIEDLGARAGLVIQTLLQTQAATLARQELEAQAGLRQVVSESSRAFAEASLSVRDALQQVTRLVAEEVGGVCVIRLLDASGQWERHAEVYHTDEAVQARVRDLMSQPMSLQDGISARAVASGRSVFLPQIDQAALRGMLAESVQAHVSPGSRHSMMCVPLRVRGRSIGVLICSAISGSGQAEPGRVTQAESRPYTEQDLRLCEELADLASLAIDHARLFEVAQDARQQAELEAARLARLQQITSLMSAASSPDDVLDALLTHGGAALGAVFGVIGTISSDGGIIEAQGSFGLNPTQQALVDCVPLGRPGAIPEAVRTGEVLYFESAEAVVERYPWLAAHPDAVPGGLLVAPLLAGGRAIGAMGFGFNSERRFDEAVRVFVGALAAQTTSALERARAFQATQEASASAQAASREAESARRLVETSLAQAQEAITRIERLQRLTGELSAAMTIEAVSEIVCREGKQALGARVGAILFVAADGMALDLVGDDGMLAESRQTWRRIPLTMATHVTEAVRTGVPVLHTTREAWSVAYPDAARWSAVIHGTSLALPMVVHGRTIGCLAYAWQEEGMFQGAGRQFASALAAQAAQAFERARLYAEAQEAVKMRDEFLSMASHELRTPLTSIKLQLDALLRQVGDDPTALLLVQAVHPKLQRLGRQADRLAKLVMELLDVARVSQGRLPLDIEEVDLRQVVREVADRHAEELSRQACALWLQCAPAVGAWDRSRLDQVVTNLLSNALKYGAGKPITVTTAVVGDEAVLTVRDQGIGIAAENHQRVFERFERLVSTRHYGGFGIGLWIVAEIVQAFGGRIDVDSVPGQGAAFIVHLPLQQARPVTQGLSQ